MKKIASSKSRIADILMFLIGSLPIFWALGVVLLAIRARIYLGYWPAPNQPDPQVLPFDIHTWILFLATYAVLWSIPIILILKKLLSNWIKWTAWHRTKLILVSGWTLILILTVAPQINFVAWYLD